LLERRGGERRGRVAPRLALFDEETRNSRAFQRGDDLAAVCCRSSLGLRAVDLVQLGREDDPAGAVGALASRAVIDQYSRGTKARISRSRSTISRTATDCTRPAESPPRTLAHSSGEIL
jgi:hypothetical protein